jgi:hypothetical protein
MDAGGRCCSLLRNWAIRRIGSSATAPPGVAHHHDAVFGPMGIKTCRLRIPFVHSECPLMVGWQRPNSPAGITYVSRKAYRMGMSA